MPAKPSKQVAPKWTLALLRSRASDLRTEDMDDVAYYTLQRTMQGVALAGWVVSFALALAAADLVLFHTPTPVPFVQEEQGMVQRLAVTPYPPQTHTAEVRHGE